MSESYDPHELLGLEPGSSEDEIRKAFRRKAKTVHPDVSDAPDANEEFVRVQAAHDLLIQRLTRPTTPAPESLYRKSEPVDKDKQERIVQTFRRRRQANERRRSRRNEGKSRQTREAEQRGREFQEEMARRRANFMRAERQRQEANQAQIEEDRLKQQRRFAQEREERERAKRNRERLEEERRKEQQRQETREQEREERERQGRQEQRRLRRERAVQREREWQQQNVRARNEPDSLTQPIGNQSTKTKREEQASDKNSSHQVSDMKSLPTCAWKNCQRTDKLSAPVATLLGTRRFCQAHYDEWLAVEKQRRQASPASRGR